MDGTVERLYGAWPARACVIDTKGRIAFASRGGPQGVRAAEIESALQRTLATQ
jgi:hypothetical protein